jgi:glycosyltransferase involved in cell wall biosynthesis
MVKPHFVCNTRSGLVSRSKDPQKIAEMIMRLAIDRALAKELGTNGYNFIQENLSLEKIGERFMRIITASLSIA